MRLQNYYVERTDIDDVGEEYDNLDFFDQDRILSEDWDYYSITHCWENHDGTFEEEEIFLYQNNKVEIDEENLISEEDLEESKEEFANGKQLWQLKKMSKEELIETIREIDKMWNYECGCNKQLVETQNKNERYKILLYNYICYVESELGITEIEQAEEMGITAEEYKEITDKT